ncbi:phosphotransferase enzyme family protein-like protein [Massarina eburnea CBS 473.64]|uniref:Phosphotransferase enzyme family protein-like protein n=1 Tax=Massarina eburnea CBS 473.64 TaxID=1395130 RepID=A0A6A6RPE2_9PLEO|nr:phosphotransferase enzyme family protein-like protein [Massarina eburnea CBS 473.64]
MTFYDQIAEKISDDEWEEWKKRVLSVKDDVAQFVAQHRPGSKHAEVVNWLEGSFNLCLRITFGDGGTDAMIRFPGPGRNAFREEKTVNEINAIQFIQENTTIPVPRLIAWGLTKDSPQQLGPFIISEFVQGTCLSNFVADPSSPTDLWLDPDVDDKLIDTVYEQISDFMLQLFRFDFDKIGAISKDKESWVVTGRPLTYAMNKLATSAFYPMDKMPTSPFHSATDYFKAVADSYMTHLVTQRNFCTSRSSAEQLYTARQLFARCVPQYCTWDSPFKLFCDDFRAQNMLIDPDTYRITAVYDLEFTNAMPKQYACSAPWWLLLIGPEVYLFRDRTIDEFKTAYEPRLNQFLAAMRRVEAAKGTHADDCLSGLMAESWDSKTCWFNVATRRPIDIDTIFENSLNDKADGLEALDEEMRVALPRFVAMKMEQLREYDSDCKRLL